jgi:hypothetical protein
MDLSTPFLEVTSNGRVDAYQLGFDEGRVLPSRTSALKLPVKAGSKGSERS